MKNLFDAAIRGGHYDLDTMLRRIDEYHIAGKLTDAEHAALQVAARKGATPGVDASAEVQRLWAAVNALSARVAALEGNADDEAIADFVQPTGAHDAYFQGDKVVFGGRLYTCNAPAGIACVWSPVVMPDYWRAS